MALNLMLRRLSSSVRPLAVRAVGSPRTFRSVISAVLSVEKGTLNRSHFLPFLQFSTKPSSDENLIRILESEIDCAEKPTVNSPFAYLVFQVLFLIPKIQLLCFLELNDLFITYKRFLIKVNALLILIGQTRSLTNMLVSSISNHIFLCQGCVSNVHYI